MGQYDFGQTNNEERRRRPYAFVSPEDRVLFIENVAQMLGCSVKQVRSIPYTRLPVHSGPGKRKLYLRDEVEGYVASLPHSKTEEDVSSEIDPDDAENVVVFDPAAELRKIREGDLR
ncbi:MAG TPA: hypothetical protein DCG48_07535 [Rhodospirillaceae bacterium]|nr:hypothetical protein [Rhodospirillaceae bacterium]|tara:strand:+ start:6319 stop:6669 length:351 start_codon:yes stop_codon:yes gene_type:complete